MPNLFEFVNISFEAINLKFRENLQAYGNLGRFSFAWISVAIVFAESSIRTAE